MEAFIQSRNLEIY